MKTPRHFLHTIVTSVCLLVLGHGAAHAANTWDGGSLLDSNWNTADNWDDDSVPGSPAGLTFDGTDRLDPFNDLKGFQVNGFTFGATAGSFEISGNSIALNGNISSLSTNTQTINLDMGLVGTSTRSISLSGGGVILDGVISGSGALSVPNSDVGSLTLNGNNSYSGGTTLGGGTGSNKTLNLGHVNALGTGPFSWAIGNTAASSLDNTSGAAMTVSNVVSFAGGGTMRFLGSDDFTFSENITSAGGRNLVNNDNDIRTIQVDAGTVTFGGNFALNTDSGVGIDLRLLGGGNLTIDGVVSNYNGVGGTAGGIIHAGTGTLTLANEASTYTGATIFSNGSSTPGVIVATKLADGGEASSIGASASDAGNFGTGSGKFSEATLRYIGSGDTTDRLFTLGGSEQEFTIESSGTGALDFTNTGSTETNGSGGKTMVLGGTYTGGVNTMAVNLTSSAGAIALRKEGAGTWALTNSNGYTGSTIVNGGTLRVSGTGSINSSNGITVNDSGSTFEYTSSVGLDRDVTVETGGEFVHSGSTNYSGSFTWTNGTLGGTNWNGNLDGRIVSANRVISPGNSPGTAATGDQEWRDDGGYIWEINNATGIAGSDPGWDLVSGTGGLTISAGVANPFIIYVTSLDLANDSGNAANFNSGTNYEWLIADFVDSVVGFDSDSFAVDLSDFSNGTLPGSEFSVVLGDAILGGDDSQIYLTYAIPEPSTMALLAGCAVLALCVLRRRNP